MSINVQIESVQNSIDKGIAIGTNFTDFHELDLELF